MKALFSKRGQALVELAIALPVILLLIFGIVEFGRVFGTYLALMHSTREGARLASVGESDYYITAAVQQRTSYLDSTKLIIQIEPIMSSRKRGEAVTVKATYPVKIYAPFISGIIGNPYVVEAKSIMRIE